MNDAQLSAILVAILDILTAMNTEQRAHSRRLSYATYADDRGQTDAIAKVRELVAGH